MEYRILNRMPESSPKSGRGFLWMTRSHSVLKLVVLLLLVSACNSFGPRPTPDPIFVTATPLPNPSTPTPADTSVVSTAATADESTDASALLPTLIPATDTPLPTSKPTLTPSFTPTFTDTPPPKRSKTPIGAAGTCTATAQGGFATILAQNSAFQVGLGCAVGPATAVSGATLSMQNGSMLYASALGDFPQKVIYALYNNGTYQRYDDNWVEGVDPSSPGETPPSGYSVPVRGFGKVWHNNPPVKNGLGWATGSEQGTGGELQRFQRGEMYFVASLKQTFIFISGTTNSWQAVGTPF